MASNKEPLQLPQTLPEATLTLTIPSIHDNLPLDCRVYHPLSLNPSRTSKAPHWAKHVAVVAHPYSPLGGCQDDHIVSAAASTLLRVGFMVTTFNFRGAGGSPGRTTWSGKGERADYISVVGFLIYYSHFLDPFPQDPMPPSASKQAASPVFLFGGYSYGGNIVMQLPSLEIMLSSYEAPISGSPAAEIRMRAQHTAEMQNTVLASIRAARTRQHGNGERSPRKSLGVRIGGDEENRRSHDSRRSFSFDREDMRRGFAEIMHKTGRKGLQNRTDRVVSMGSSKAAGGKTGREQKPDCLPAVLDLVRHRPSYLLISPPQGLFRNLLNLSFTNPFSSERERAVDPHPPPVSPADVLTEPAKGVETRLSRFSEAEQKLVLNTTLVIYGDHDFFLPLKKTREWASSLTGVPQSRFRAHEVAGAGHFWVEGRVLHVLTHALDTYARSLLQDSDLDVEVGATT